MSKLINETQDVTVIPNEVYQQIQREAVFEMLSSGGFITLNKKAVRIFGLENAVLIGEFVSKEKYLKENGSLTEDGFFYSTIEDVENNTSLKERTQQRLIADLKAKDIIQVELRGLPARRHIKINYEKLFKQMCENC